MEIYTISNSASNIDCLTGGLLRLLHQNYMAAMRRQEQELRVQNLLATLAKEHTTVHDIPTHYPYSTPDMRKQLRKKLRK